MDKQKLVLIGNGMAGIRCIEEILKIAPDTYDITIFGREPHVNYNRILLSTVLQGSTSFEDITINDHNWYEENSIHLFVGETVVHIDTDNKMIKTDQGRVVNYNKLIIGTGSVPFILPISGIDKEGVLAFRTIEDCKKMIEISKQYKKAVVIGGGLLGLEAARGLLNLGMKVDVVHKASYLMNKQLDPTASNMLKKELENQGMNFLLEKETQEILGKTRVEGVRFKDGMEIEADLVVMAVGVRPNIQLAKENGIDTNRAILVNDYLETNMPDIYAVGECTEHRGMVYGLVKPLYEQGKVLAKYICGMECEGYQGSVLSTQLKISGVDVFSVGQFTDDKTTKSITVFDELDGVYKKIVFRDNKIIGAVLYGETSDGLRLLDMILKQKDVSDLEKVVLCQSPEESNNQVIAMTHSDMICNCNGVSKGAIIEAIQKEGLTTVEQIKTCTKASGSCGGCKPLVSELLKYVQSDSFDEVIEHKSMCSCTTLTEDEVVQEIQLRNLSSVQEIMGALNWGKSEGCSVCRPALHYYLGMIHPEYERRQDELSVNVRMNAILQNDGTYSVTPQMYGGITNADELRRIADVVEKYQIPNVVVTSEQRIHLKGVKKEKLAHVCSELNMPLHSAYRHTIQNVKICLGADTCQCDQHSAFKLARDLERNLEFLITPDHVKVSIAPCIHNGEEVLSTDIGLIRIDRGWEIRIGGSSGRNGRIGDILYVAETSEEALKTISAFIQYYRETASYLESTGQWIDRIGIIHIREVLFDTELCHQLLDRLESDLLLYKKDLERSYP